MTRVALVLMLTSCSFVFNRPGRQLTPTSEACDLSLHVVLAVADLVGGVGLLAASAKIAVTPACDAIDHNCEPTPTYLTATGAALLATAGVLAISSSAYGAEAIATCRRAQLDSARETQALEVREAALHQAFVAGEAARAGQCERARAAEARAKQLDPVLYENAIVKSDTFAECRVECAAARQSSFMAAENAPPDKRPLLLESIAPCDVDDDRWSSVKRAALYALHGNCERASDIATRIRDEDPAFFENVLARNASIADCVAKYPQTCAQRRAEIDLRAKTITSPEERLELLRSKPLCEK